MRRNEERPKVDGLETFIKDIRASAKKQGSKNAVCIIVGDNDDVTLINLNENTMQLLGMLDVGKALLLNDSLSFED